MRTRDKKALEALSAYLSQLSGAPKPEELAAVIGTSTGATGCVVSVADQQFHWGGRGDALVAARGPLRWRATGVDRRRPGDDRSAPHRAGSARGTDAGDPPVAGDRAAAPGRRCRGPGAARPPVAGHGGNGAGTSVARARSARRGAASSGGAAHDDVACRKFARRHS